MPSETQPSRTNVLEIVRAAAAKLREAHGSDAEVPAAFREACDSVGVSPFAFDTAITADAKLELLKHAAIREAISGSTDPGPYAATSRESPSG